MSSTKQVQLAVLLLLAAAVLADTPARADPTTRNASGTARLTPPATSDEPNASGQAKFNGLRIRNPSFGWVATGDLTVTCRALTPGATYRTTAGSFTASTTGTGTVTGLWGWPGSIIVTVAREEPQDDGSVELIVVLEGTMKVH